MQINLLNNQEQFLSLQYLEITVGAIIVTYTLNQENEYKKTKINRKGTFNFYDYYSY